MHVNRAKNNERVLIYRVPLETKLPCLSIHTSIEWIHDGSTNFVRLPFYDHGNFVKFLCHCNGLVFLSDGKDLYLFNPAIRELRILPPSPSIQLPPDLPCWTVGTGFGYDAITDDYKVVQLAEYQGNKVSSIFKAEICSLKTDSWRQISAVIPDSWRQIDTKYPVLEPPYFSVFFNGFIHWSTLSKARRRAVMLSFHISTEVFLEIDLPDDVVEVAALDVLGESLVLFSENVHLLGTDVWVMKKYGVKNSWTKIYHIGLESGFPLACWKNELLLHSYCEKKLILCPPTAGQEIPEFDAFACWLFPFPRVIIYKESLISIKRREPNTNHAPAIKHLEFSILTRSWTC